MSNVIDYYKEWETEAIKADLDTRRSQMVNICMNLTHDFNKGSVIRANNAFCGKEVWIIGRRRYDRRGAVGTYHYEHVKHAPELAEVAHGLKEEGYILYAVDNTPEYSPVALYDVEFPERTAFVYGEEREGLTADVLALCDQAIYIPQFGSVRSLNVAQAAAVCMSEYARRHREF